MPKKSVSKRDQTSVIPKHDGSDCDLTGSGSGSGMRSHCCKFCPKGQLLPVELTLHLDFPIECDNQSTCRQLNRPTPLIHAQDPAFACSWFSRAIDLADDGGNPAFWMLQKTALDTWTLYLRRVSGQLAVYQLKSKIKHFPIQLKKGRATKEFNWPSTITISQGG